MQGLENWILKIFYRTGWRKSSFLPHGRIAFSGIAEMQQTMGSPEGQSTAADLSNFATGGVTFLVGEVYK